MISLGKRNKVLIFHLEQKFLAYPSKFSSYYPFVTIAKISSITNGSEHLILYLRGHIDKFCLQVHNFGNNEDKQMILTPNKRSFYLAPDDISFFNIITVPFDTEPPPTDDLLDAVSEEVSSLVSAPRKNSILHIFVCLVTVALEVILDIWKKEEIARSKIWAIRRVR